MSLRRILPGIVLSATLLACSSDPAPSTEPADTGTGADAVGDASPESCEDDEALCGGECVDTLTDDDNCGGCGRACPTEAFCSDAQCTCPAGLGICDEACIDLDADPRNCGECGNVCGSLEVCDAGRCVTDCSEGRTVCAGSCVDTDQNPRHCGGCDIACPSDINEDAFCEDRECGRVCRVGFFDLDDAPGCEYACDGDPDDEEVCDGVDNDCDGLIDEEDDDYVAPLCAKQLGVCEGSVAACIAGEVQGCDDPEYEAFAGFTYTGGEDRCDGLDNDCDGLVDEADPEYRGTPCGDSGDLVGACAGAVSRCSDGAALECTAADYDAAQPDQRYFMGADAFCDRTDNDCNGEIDEYCCPSVSGEIDVTVDSEATDYRQYRDSSPNLIVSNDRILAVFLEYRQNTLGSTYEVVVDEIDPTDGSQNRLFTQSVPAGTAVAAVADGSGVVHAIVASAFNPNYYRLTYDPSGIVPNAFVPLDELSAEQEDGYFPQRVFYDRTPSGDDVVLLHEFQGSANSYRMVRLSGSDQWDYTLPDSTYPYAVVASDERISALVLTEEGTDACGVEQRSYNVTFGAPNQSEIMACDPDVAPPVLHRSAALDWPLAGFSTGSDSSTASIDLDPSSDAWSATENREPILTANRPSTSAPLLSGSTIVFYDSREPDTSSRIIKADVFDERGLTTTRSYRGENLQIVASATNSWATALALRVSDAGKSGYFFATFSADGRPLCGRD